MKLQPHLLICIGLCGSVSGALAAQPAYPTKAYDAMYERSDSQGITDYRMVSDGKGHTRIESQSPNNTKSVVIFDYPKQQMIILLNQQKLAMKQPLDTSANGQIDEQKIKSLGGTALGAKLVQGRPCHGWKYQINGVTSECWNADDIPITVVRWSITPQGKEEQLLKTLSTTQPPADLFEVPPGYKLTDMKAMMGR